MLTYLITELRIYLITYLINLPMRSHNNMTLYLTIVLFSPNMTLCLLKSHSVVLFQLFIFKNHFFLGFTQWLHRSPQCVYNICILSGHLEK